MSILKKVMLLFSSIFIFASLGSFCVYADDYSSFSILDDCQSNKIFSVKNNSSGHFKSLPKIDKIATCEYSPSRWHEAFARGIGVLYRGSASGSNSLVYRNGCAWQCKYCNEVIVTQGEAAQGASIGYYATYNPGYQISRYGTVLYSNNIYYTNSSTLEGINFRYN